MQTWIVFGVGASLCLAVGCSPSEESEGEGLGGGSGASGLAGESGSASAGTGGGGSLGAADCSLAEVLPAEVEQDLTVGPGCVRIERTRVTGGATLTVAPGTRVLMGPAGFLALEDSALVSVGSEAEPIVFTSDASAPAAGDWQCIHVDDGSSATEIQFTTLEYGGAACAATGANHEAMLAVFGAARAIDNNTFRSSVTHAVRFGSGGSARSFENNSFANNTAPSILVAAPELLVLGTGLGFADADDLIEVDTTFSLGSTGTWRAQPVPFLIVGKLNIDDEAEVTIAAGNELRFNGSSLEVFNANLIVAGTEAEPVVFTSTQATPRPGDWGCLMFSAVSGVPRIDNAIIEYAGNGMGCTGGNHETAISAIETAIITNTTFRQIAGSAIRVNGDCDTAGWCANTFEAVETGPLECAPGGTATACSAPL